MKCLVTDSVNEGYVTAKKNGAGGICGYMNHGIIVNSECYGSTKIANVINSMHIVAHIIISNNFGFLLLCVDIHFFISSGLACNSTWTDACTNKGIVKGDINVGGIAGAMSIDEEDPEDSAAGGLQ